MLNHQQINKDHDFFRLVQTWKTAIKTSFYRNHVNFSIFSSWLSSGIQVSLYFYKFCYIFEQDCCEKKMMKSKYFYLLKDKYLWSRTHLKLHARFKKMLNKYALKVAIVHMIICLHKKESVDVPSSERRVTNNYVR